MTRNTNYIFKLPVKIMLPFFVAIALWAFVPSRAIPTLHFYNIPIELDDTLLILFCVPYSIILLGYRHLNIDWQLYKSIMIFLALGLYAIYSISDSAVFYDNRYGAYVTIILFFSSFTFAYLFLIFSRSSPKYIYWLTLLVCIIATLYLAQSLFSLGLRQLISSDFGIDRVRGPLFGPSTGQIILLPALGFILDRIIIGRNRGLVNLSIAFLLFASLLGLGSRSGLIVMFIFVIISILAVNTFKNKVIFITIMLIIAIPSYGVIFSQADNTRLLSLEDNIRQKNLQTSFDIFSKESLSDKLFGKGYASTWPWYIIDKNGENKRLSGENLIHTSDGDLLYHPHSTFLFFMIELGLLPTILFLLLPVFALQKLIKNVKLNGDVFLGSSLLSSFLAMFFDFFIFKNFILSSIWVIYLIYYISSKRENHTLRKPYEPSNLY